jgi:hypothetical protein
MAIFRYGNIWDAYDISDIFVITGNSFIKNNGSLAMGKGIALETQTRFPEINKIFGKMIITNCGHLGIYNLINYDRIYLLQTKVHYQNPSPIKLVIDSVNKLKDIIKIPNNQTKNQIVNMVFPGIGNGKLTKEEVYNRCLINLPNNVTIWYK